METLLRSVLQEKADQLSDKGHILFWTAPDTPMAEAVRMMDEGNVGCLLVMDAGRLVGLLNERDVIRGLSAHGAALGDKPVSDVMSVKPVSVSPSMSVYQAMVECTERRARHLPVLEDGELLGLISIGDLVRLVAKDKEKRISDLMGYIQG
ncbi:MAG: CBS domain-containing protein [Aquimonas sp.]|nr:CBS domain-containing protein [Aquimonas sp.]